ncbi:NADH dehydrogenase [ubiquinone] 1 alpha subcomplex subunit 11-like [Macrosteles quadrilineatus]|uniref:NADH dehydrogenase [ubiquinone] 1 alpha subcomplex subunit 11-like n=1 Tax=Macrosteles quadrilineatus TaxID=74068 RepID=UPI0023E0E2EF|nr:NADH dehydrogenase [ubiquinone] 1 alpha subcomplex subunit 11-like [Macrosteles quadrilineatus]XP_054279067.1 NADH dehydrogenase [ubiquinone] 1 alpha subcomplex subunit 11-like [Macrosteles quadrilineatus]
MSSDSNPQKKSREDSSPFPWLNRIPGYHYYDTPDGEDCLQKVIYMNKVGALLGGFYSTLDVLTLSKPVGVGNIALRYATLTLPVMAVGSTFAAVTCLSTSFRDKDDIWNYFYGGLAAGSVAGAAARNGVVGTVCAFSFGVLGMVKKYSVQEGFDLFPPVVDKDRTSHLGPWSIHWDFTLARDDQPKGWKSADK